MTPDDVRATAECLVDFHERFAPLIGKEQAQDHAYDYLKGLMVCPERKSIEPTALNDGHGDVSGLQKFVGAAPNADKHFVWGDRWLVPTLPRGNIGPRRLASLDCASPSA
jgi:SRSO17 transposase